MNDLVCAPILNPAFLLESNWITFRLCYFDCFRFQPQNIIAKLLIWAVSLENLTKLHAINKQADLPAHPHRLINAFAICSQERIIAKFTTQYTQHFSILARSLYYWACLVWVWHGWSPEDRFSHFGAHLSMSWYSLRSSFNPFKLIICFFLITEHVMRQSVFKTFRVNMYMSMHSKPWGIPCQFSIIN